MSEKEKEKTGYMGYLKSVSLVILTLQNTLIVLVGKAATIKSAPDKFLTCTVVTISEIAKFIVCSLFLLKRCESFSSFVKTFHEELFIKYRQTLKVSVPALLYVIQNNLLLVGIDNLPAAVFQVSTQLKILTTALMSVMLLRKKLSWSQWMALVFLFLGVILVNIKLDKKQNPTAISNKSDGNPLLGMTSVVVCALTSAFSGVYFEKLLKHEKFDLIYHHGGGVRCGYKLRTNMELWDISRVQYLRLGIHLFVSVWWNGNIFGDKICR
ncbi:UDP-galactose translocator [Thelohanellus kitauei]|uniref:UDP-galactose translocator n=1 Tax=Thelohanellus kitauei TaxID=669202 RepID=A0A0C2JWI8_THEKT|nr:UDP-galactose translocator [Thelohanellus kitauei]